MPFPRTPQAAKSRLGLAWHCVRRGRAGGCAGQDCYCSAQAKMASSLLFAGGEKNGSQSDLGAVLQQAHQHAALVVLATKKHGQHLDFPLLRAWTKPIHGTIESQVTKTREEIIV